MTSATPAATPAATTTGAPAGTPGGTSAVPPTGDGSGSRRRAGRSRLRARLEARRDDLLERIEHLDDDHAQGRIDPEEYRTLRDDLTLEAAAVIRRLQGLAPAAGDTRASRPPWYRSRGMLVPVVLGLFAVGAGLFVARNSGTRLSGQVGSGEISRSSRDFMVEAQAAIGQGDLVAAQESIDAALEISPDDPDVLLLEANVKELDGDIVGSLQVLDQILAVDPDNVGALTRRGWILVRLPEEDLQTQGIELLDRAIELGAPSFDVYFFRAIAAERIEGDLTSALDYYQQAIDHGAPPGMVPQIEANMDDIRTQIEVGG